MVELDSADAISEYRMAHRYDKIIVEASELQRRTIAGLLFEALMFMGAELCGRHRLMNAAVSAVHTAR